MNKKRIKMGVIGGKINKKKRIAGKNNRLIMYSSLLLRINYLGQLVYSSNKMSSV